MIVSKAVNMAKLMNIPVLGIVENMSYLKCPECGKELEIFGASKVAAVAERFGIAHTARIPVDPAVSALVDEGKVESVDGAVISGFADFLEKEI